LPPKIGSVFSSHSLYVEELITVKRTDPVIEALKLFVNTQVGRLIVVDEKQKLAGILTKGDITSGLLRALQANYQIEELKNIGQVICLKILNPTAPA